MRPVIAATGVLKRHFPDIFQDVIDIYFFADEVTLLLGLDCDSRFHARHPVCAVLFGGNVLAGGHGIQIPNHGGVVMYARNDQVAVRRKGDSLCTREWFLKRRKVFSGRNVQIMNAPVESTQPGDSFAVRRKNAFIDR